MTSFADLLSKVTAESNNILIAGDFNINVSSTSQVSSKLATILTDFNLHQHVTSPTHTNSHTIDLVMSLKHEHLGNKVTDIDRSVSSDHFSVILRIDCPKPPRVKHKIKVRKLKDVNMETLNDLVASLIPSLSIQRILSKSTTNL
jgi:hypothetical protein